MKLNLNKQELLTKSKEEIIDVLFAVIADLYKENMILKEEITELKSKLNIPKKDSNNSSQPPSTDNKAKIESKKEKKFGPPNGHKANHKILSKNPDEIREYKIKECPHCGHEIESKSCNSIRRQWIELKEIKIEVIEERRQLTTCPICKKTVYAAVPKEKTIAPKMHIGPNLKTITGLLYYQFGVSRSKIKEFISTYSNQRLSNGSIDKIMKELSSLCNPIHKNIMEEIRKSELVQVDETGWRVSGENNWAWAFQNKLLTLYVIKPSRASKIPIEVLGKDFNGILVSDFYSSYSLVSAKHKAKCSAHLIRDLKYGVEIEKEPTGFCQQMLDIVLDAIIIRKMIEILPTFDEEQHIRKEIEVRIDNELSRTDLKGDSRRLWKRIKKYRTEIFLFLYNLNVPSNNNTTEQAIRKLVIHRKRSNGSRSTNGAEGMSNIMSVIETCKKQSINIYSFVRDLFKNSTSHNDLFCSS